MLAVIVAAMLGGFQLPFAELIATSTPQDRWIDSLAQCESMGSTTVKVLDTDGYYSYGLFQFHQATWLKYGKPFGATKENIYDGELQREVVRSMLDNGGSSHWYNCSKRLGRYPAF